MASEPTLPASGRSAPPAARREIGEKGYPLDSGDSAGSGFVGRSPWPAADTSSAPGAPARGPTASDGALSTSLLGWRRPD